MARYTQLIHDQWLSEIFGQDVSKLIIMKPGEAHGPDFLQAIGDALKRKGVFIYSKIPVNAIACSHGLERLGFYLVDTNINFKRQIVRYDMVNGSTSVRFARMEDEEKVGCIAQHNFVYSRFHLDPKIPTNIANTIKAKWALNFFTGKRGDAMVVYSEGDRLLGFLQLLYRKESLVIDLIAVNEKDRRKNIACDMINFAQNNLNDFGYVSVGTQLANIPSMRFYQKLGFQIADTSYIFHYHN